MSERLKEIQIKGLWDLEIDDLRWLIQQAERVEELEKENQEYKKTFGYLANRHKEKNEEIRRLKQSRDNYRRKWRKTRDKTLEQEK